MLSARVLLFGRFGFLVAALGLSACKTSLVAGPAATKKTESTTTTTGPSLSGLSILATSPTRLTTLPLLVGSVSGGASEYCILVNAAESTACSWKKLPLPASVAVAQLSQDVQLSAWVRNSAGDLSSRVDSNKVTVDLVPPAAPTSVTTEPASGSASLTPFVKGTVASDVVSVSLYRDTACATLVGSGGAAIFQSVGIQVPVLGATTTTIYGQTQDAAGNASACTSLVSYTQVPPAGGPALSLGFLSITPLSPNASASPVITGWAGSGVTSVEFFSDVACSVSRGTATVASFTGAGATVTVPANALTTLFAKGTDGIGSFTSCTYLTTYQNDSVVPVWTSTPLHVSAYSSLVATPPVTWSADATDANGILRYEYAVGTANSGGSVAAQADVVPWTTASSATIQRGGLTLTEGATYYFNMRAVDYAGNRSAVRSSAGWVADTVAPASPTLSATTPVSPSNASTAPKLSGTAVGAQTIRIYTDSLCTILATEGPAADFTSAGITVNVSANTTTTFRARAVDAAGNASTCSGPLSYTHDNQAPVVSSLTVTSASPTRSTAATLVWGSVTGDSVSYCILENVATPASCSWAALPLPTSFTLSNTENSKVLYGWVKDAAGNVSASAASNAVVYDITPPGAITAFSTVPVSGSSVQAPLVRGTAPADVVQVSLYSDLGCSTLIGSGTRDAIIGSGIQVSVAANATTSIYSQTRDAAGNNGSCTLLGSYTHADGGGSGTAYVAMSSYSPASPSSTSMVTFKGTASANVATVNFFSDLGCTQSLGTGTRANFVGAAGISISMPLNVATNVYARGTTSGGDLSACTGMATFVHDSSAPTTPASVTHASWYNSLSATPVVTWAASTDSLSGIAGYDYSVGTSIGGTNILGWTSVGNVLTAQPAVTLTAGPTYYFNVRARDAAGNVSGVRSSSGWVVDLTGPALTVAQPAELDPVTTPTRGFSGACETGTMVNFSYGANVSGPASVSCTNGSYVGKVAFSGLKGNRAVTISQSDVAGNVTSITRTVAFGLAHLEQYGFTGGDVRAIEPLNDGTGRVYYGGTFTAYQGITANNIVRVNQDGTRDYSFNAPTALNGTVYTIRAMADGRIYIGGAFTSVQGVSRPYIARLNADGTLDTSFAVGAGFDFYVLSIKFVPDGSGDIYVGGFFTTYQGASAKYIIRLTSAGAVNTAFNPGTGFNNYVYDIQLDSNAKLYVGGYFTTYQGTAANYLIRLNPDGSKDTGFDNTTGFNSYVYGLAVASDDKVYVTGLFTTWKGTTSNYLVRLNTNGSYDSTFNVGTGLSATGYGVTVASDGKLYVGGTFGTASGTTHSLLVRYNTNGTVDSTFTGAGFVGTYVWKIVQSPVDTSNIYVGGYFSSYRGAGANNGIRLLSTGVADHGTNFGAGPGGSWVYVVEPTVDRSGKAYVGFDGTTFDGAAANYFLRINADGSRDTSFNTGTGFDAYVHTAKASVFSPGKVYVGGNFTTYNLAPTARLARLNADGTLDTTFVIGAGLNGLVRTIAEDPITGKVYVGGDFTSFNGVAGRNYILRLNPDGSFDSTFNVGTGPESGVYALALTTDASAVYLGGNFTTFNGVTANRITRVLASGVIDTSFSAGTGFSYYVFDIVLVGDGSNDIYVAGFFTGYQGIAANGLARLNSSGVLSTTFDTTTGIGTPNSTPALRIRVQDDGKLLVGGYFTSYKGVSVGRIVRLLPNAALDTSFLNGASFGDYVYSLGLMNDGTDRVIVGGYYLQYAGTLRPRLTKLRTDGKFE